MTTRRGALSGLAIVVAAALVAALAWMSRDEGLVEDGSRPSLDVASAEPAPHADLAPPTVRAPAPVEPLDVAPPERAPDGSPRDVGAFLEGIVRDRETLRPVAGAVVALTGRVVGSVSDADGRYRLALPEVASAGVVARHPEYASEPKVWKRGVHGEHLAFTLKRGVAVTIECVDRDDGRPLVGAELREVPDGEAIARADGSGRLVLRVLPERDTGFVFAHEGHASLWWLWDGDGAYEGLRARVPLRRPAWVDARVVDDAGRPLAGAALRVGKPVGLHFRLDPQLVRDCGLPGDGRDVEPSTTAQTDDGGVVHLALLPWKDDYRLTARMPRHASVESQPFALRAAGDRVSLEFVLHAAGRVQGRVLRNGEPLGNTFLRCLDDAGESLGSVRTNGRGEYAVDDVLPGAVHVEVRDPKTGRLHHREVVVEAGRTAICDVIITQDFDVLGGSVSWSSGMPADHVFVLVSANGRDRFTSHVETDAGGRFGVEVPAAGTFTVTATAATSSSARGVPAGTRDLALVLAAQATLSLRLVDALTEESITPTHAWLSRRAAGESSYRFIGTGRPDASGLVTLQLPAGRVDLAVDLRHQGYPVREVLGVEVDDDLPPLDVRLERVADVALRFVGPGGRARGPTGHLVWVVPESSPDGVREASEGDTSTSSYVLDGRRFTLHFDDDLLRPLHVPVDDADGSATLRGLPAGRWMLRIFPDDVQLRPEIVVVPRDGGRVLDVSFAPVR